MAHEHRAFEIELARDFDDVYGIAVECCVFAGIVRRQVRTACADVIEEDRPEVALEDGRDEAPHVLIAAEAVSKDHCPLSLSPLPATWTLLRVKADKAASFVVPRLRPEPGRKLATSRRLACAFCLPGSRAARPRQSDPASSASVLDSEPADFPAANCRLCN